MTSPALTAIVARPYDRYHALMDGRVQLKGAPLGIEVAHRPIVAFDALLRNEFVVGEMSMAFFSILRSHGFDQLVGLPVFPLKMFRHADILVREESDLHSAADLVGKRIALPEYTMTSGVWVRQLLLKDHGVLPSHMSWVTLREPVMVSAEQAQPTEDVSITLRPGANQFDLLRAGEVDAAVGTLPRRQAADQPRLRFLFDDPCQLELDYYRTHGHVPVNHLLVMQRAAYEQDPELARLLYQAFDESKDAAVDALCDFGFPPISLPQGYHAVREQLARFGDDPWAYGIERNHRSVQALLDACRDQGLLGRDLAVSDLFVPELLDT